MTEQSKFVCDKCNKSFKTAAALKGHITREHKPKIKTVKKEKKIYTDNDTVLVRNGCSGTLNYVGRKTGIEYIFNEFGDELEIEFGDLKATKSGDGIKFFKNNWFLIDDADALEQLKITQYYKDAMTYDDFINFFTYDIDTLKEKVSRLTKSQKATLGVLAVEKIEQKELTDLKVIDVLEDALGEELYYK